MFYAIITSVKMDFVSLSLAQLESMVLTPSNDYKFELRVDAAVAANRCIHTYLMQRLSYAVRGFGIAQGYDKQKSVDFVNHVFANMGSKLKAVVKAECEKTMNKFHKHFCSCNVAGYVHPENKPFCCDEECSLPLPVQVLSPKPTSISIRVQSQQAHNPASFAAIAAGASAASPVAAPAAAPAAAPVAGPAAGAANEELDADTKAAYAAIDAEAEAAKMAVKAEIEAKKAEAKSNDVTLKIEAEFSGLTLKQLHRLTTTLATAVAAAEVEAVAKARATMKIVPDRKWSCNSDSD